MTANINYIELPAGPLDATKQFYSDAFGWSWTDYGPSYAAYEGASITIGLNASASATAPPVAGAEDGNGPLVLFEATDLEQALASIRKAGGAVTSEPYAYPGGRRFHFQDPAGSTLGVYQSQPSSEV